MKIKSVELINVKSYIHADIEFSETINLIVGANNSGKSTIIKSLLNLQYQSFDRNDIRISENYSKMYTKIIDVNEQDNLLFVPPNYRLKDYEISNKFTICWGITNSLQPEENLYYDPTKYKVERYGRNQIKLFDEFKREATLNNFVRFSDSEDKNNFIYPFLANRRANYRDSDINQKQAFRVSRGLINLAAKIQKISNSSHPQNSRFNKLCDDILGFRIGVIPVAENTGIEPGIYVTSTKMIPISSMGDGVSNIVGFIVILLTEDQKLFLVEELENDIHPSALKKLLSLIVEKAANNQFVISTHSHIILKHLGAISNSKIFYVDWKPCIDEGEQKHSIPTSYVKEIENNAETRIEILKKLGYDFNDFELFESYLILEESSAERVIRDFLIPNIIPELYNKIKTIAANGVNDLEIRVVDFNRLFVFIHTNPIYFGKAWVIADGDSVGKECILNLQKKFEKWPKNHFINFERHDFELYYPERFQKKVTEVLKLKDQNKRSAKKQLLDEVMIWALKNRESAITEFLVSAKEVIDILKMIEDNIK